MRENKIKVQVDSRLLYAFYIHFKCILLVYFHILSFLFHIKCKAGMSVWRNVNLRVNSSHSLAYKLQDGR